MARRIFQNLASKITKRNQGKKRVSIGDVRECLRILVDLEVEHIDLGLVGLFEPSPAELIRKRALLVARRKKVKR